MADTDMLHSTNGAHAPERNAEHEFTAQDAAEGLRRGHHDRVMAEGEAEPSPAQGEEQPRSRKTRGGTHEQHTAAGKKGGSRIRQLIELGYKYEQEHGIGPGQSKRSKLAKRPAD